MPLYPYHCPYCESYFDVLRKSSDDGIEECPKCGQTLFKEHRTVGSMTFDLKGQGWANDSYGNNKYKWQE